MKHKGFTLAEILITLTVIGIFAAIVTPVLKKAFPDQNIVLFRKAYNVVVTAVSELINDEQSYPSTVLGSTINPTMTNQPVGFNNVSITGTLVPSSLTASDGSTYPPNKFCYLFSQMVNTTGNDFCSSNVLNGTFSTKNGMVWTIASTSPQFPLDGNNYSTRIIVDVNGKVNPSDSSTKKNGPDCSYLALNYNGTSWPACSTVSSKVWPDAADGIVPDVYDIGVRYDGSTTILKMSGSTLNTTNVDKAAATILSTPAKNTK